MLVMVLGLLVFLGVHSVSIVARPTRDAVVAARGEGPWKGVYSIVAAVGLVLLVIGYGMARQDPVPLWDPPVWTRHLSLLIMLPVFPLLLAGYLPGRIKTMAKHPMLLAVKLWATAHLIANGTLADLVLFGAFLGWAVADRISVKRRPASAAASAPPPRAANDAVALAAGLALYVAFLLALHEWLIGVAPLA